MRVLKNNCNFVFNMEGRESPQQLEVPSNECRLRITAANQTSPSSSGETIDECACGPDGLLNCVEQGAHLTLINKIDVVKA